MTAIFDFIGRFLREPIGAAVERYREAWQPRQEEQPTEDENIRVEREPTTPDTAESARATQVFNEARRRMMGMMAQMAQASPRTTANFAMEYRMPPPPEVTQDQARRLIELFRRQFLANRENDITTLRMTEEAIRHEEQRVRVRHQDAAALVRFARREAERQANDLGLDPEELAQAVRDLVDRETARHTEALRALAHTQEAQVRPQLMEIQADPSTEEAMLAQQREHEKRRKRLKRHLLAALTTYPDYSTREYRKLERKRIDTWQRSLTFAMSQLPMNAVSEKTRNEVQELLMWLRKLWIAMGYVQTARDLPVDEYIEEVGGFVDPVPQPTQTFTGALAPRMGQLDDDSGPAGDDSDGRGDAPGDGGPGTTEGS